MNDILIKIWDKLRTIQGAVMVRWGTAIVVMVVWIVPYMQVAAENAVIKIFKDRGFTIQDFKQVQDDVGSVKQGINNINNTLTINNARAEDMKKQVDALVNFIINKKVENVP